MVDGFQHEDYVLLDDFDHQGKMLGHYLKIWGDRYFGWKGETKGGTIKPNYKKFIITSNYTPEQIWEDQLEMLSWWPPSKDVFD